MEELNIAIKTKGLYKTFGKKEIIKNCSMIVKQGEIYGFLGANGAGKTTVFKLLTGLLIPTMGKAEILGLDSVKDNVEILKLVGSIIEIPTFYEHLSATENLVIHLAYMEKEKLDVEKTLQQVGLPNTGTQPVSKFSLGMRQRLAIARAISHEPKLLILDEPLNGLDPIGIRYMRELFHHLAEDKKMTILFSSHILSEVEQVANKIGVIENGTILEEVTLSEIKEKYPNGLEDYFVELLKGGKYE